MENSAKALEQTRALADTLASDKDGKFANSKFLQFVSKMSRGEIILEGNEVSKRPWKMTDSHTMQVICAAMANTSASSSIDISPSGNHVCKTIAMINLLC